MISVNSTLFELELQHRTRELERKAERRLMIGEKVHVPNRSWKIPGQVRRFLRGDDLG